MELTEKATLEVLRWLDTVLKWFQEAMLKI